LKNRSVELPRAAVWIGARAVEQRLRVRDADQGFRPDLEDRQLAFRNELIGLRPTETGPLAKFVDGERVALIHRRPPLPPEPLGRVRTLANYEGEVGQNGQQRPIINFWR
jgi:hypothetical protein